MTLVKATFRNLDTNGTVAVMFNPPEYSLSRSNDWTESAGRGSNVPGIEFTGGHPSQLTMELFFDTHISGKDVRTEYTDAIWKLALVNKDKKDSVTGRSQPPVCEFEWGSVWSFKCVITQISQKFTLFAEDGTPTRATMSLTLKQVEDPSEQPAQNPTSGGLAGVRTHTVRERDTLDFIASQEYGSASHWRYIAEANGIDDPLRLTPGMVLLLPPLVAGGA